MEDKSFCLLFFSLLEKLFDVIERETFSSLGDVNSDYRCLAYVSYVLKFLSRKNTKLVSINLNVTKMSSYCLSQSRHVFFCLKKILFGRAYFLGQTTVLILLEVKTAIYKHFGKEKKNVDSTALVLSWGGPY